MEKTWFERVFRRKAHPGLRLLGNLVGIAIHCAWMAGVITHFDTAWRWLALPIGLLGLLNESRGAALARRDLRKAAGTPVLD
ncbi:hypothetical protein [Streptomyces sp. AM 2-1-1]|uniref:hypothetical protein n=1 Tax=Streptomyces sp. AM 2-1-1 TaxID=3028709 RepID=UPI0023B94A19|nr:hypothetical protein [Streptomyces sp. AM 2-1-1]WEH38045.1 hypothetical protein PZB77_00120 [Streptomyces sp. AM 2-1-1]WEH43494.1 hypothetical protein PZB77_30660 [Streptomyces sp. AM 2-1-1]